MIRVIIIGVGGSSRSILDILKENSNIYIAGFVDDDESLHETYFENFKVLGSINDLPAFKHLFDTVVISVGAENNVINRKRIFDQIKK